MHVIILFHRYEWIGRNVRIIVHNNSNNKERDFNATINWFSGCCNYNT